MLGHIHVDSNEWTFIHNCIQQRLDTYMWTVMIGKQPNSHQIAHWGQCIVLCKGGTFAKYLCSCFAYYFSFCGLIQQILYYLTKPAHV